MKKSLALLAVITIIMLLGCSLAAAQDAVPLEIGETLEIEGLFSIRVDSYGFEDEYRYIKSADTLGYYTEQGKDTYQYMQIEIDFMNLSLSEINIQKYLSGYILFADKYLFDGIFYQRELNKKSYICTFQYPTGVLEEGRLVFMFDAPNILETSNDRLDFYLTIDGNEYIVNLR